MHKGSNFSTSSPTLGTFVFVFLLIVTIPNGGKMVSHGSDLLFPNSVLKSRDITLPTKVCKVKAMVFPVVMYHCESWNVKKAECQRIDAFELWGWRRLRMSNQSILKEINHEYSRRTDSEAEVPVFWSPDVNG